LFPAGDQDHDRQDHRDARLVNTNDRSLTKTVATDALLDRSLFRPVS
jgi:hypothetical protein